MQPQAALERFLQAKGTLLNGTWFVVVDDAGEHAKALATLKDELSRPSKCSQWGLAPGLARWENLKRAAREREQRERARRQV